jgi:hypothetical protein
MVRNATTLRRAESIAKKVLAIVKAKQTPAG